MRAFAARLAIARPLYVFGLTWVGQLVSLIGSGLTSFAVGVEIYRASGSTTAYSLYSFAYYFPLVVLSPFAGALVDRWDRRRAMLLSDLGAGLSSSLIWLLLIASKAGLWTLESWHFYLPAALSSAFGAFRWPAYYASTTLLVPKRHLGRANALVELAFAASQIAAPMLANALLLRIGFQGILVIDLGSFLVAVLTLLLVRFPRPAGTTFVTGGQALWRDVAHGWSFIRARPGLFGLMLFIATANLIVGLVSVLITPLVLSFADMSALALISSAGGLGMLVGGIMMSVWGGPRRAMKGVLGFQLMAGLVLLMGGLPPSVSLVALAAPLFLFTFPPVSSSVQTIWQKKVAPALQGRIFAVRRMISLSAPPVAALLAGPLADRFFEPWLAPGGALAGSVGRLIGTGPGRGIGFLFIILGVLCLLLTLVAYLSPRVRNVEVELPDAFDDEAPVEPQVQPNG